MSALDYIQHYDAAIQRRQRLAARRIRRQQRAARWRRRAPRIMRGLRITLGVVAVVTYFWLLWII